MSEKPIHPLAEMLVHAHKCALSDALDQTARLSELGVCINAVISTDKSPKGNRAIIAVISGPIPEDLVDGFRGYVDGLIQDYKASISSDKFSFHERNGPPENDKLPDEP